jgi:hypothetical protein
MCQDDVELTNLLRSAESLAAPQADHRAAVRARMLGLMQSSRGPRRAYRTAVVAALLVVVVGGIGLAATERGREFIRWLFVPIEDTHVTQWESPDGGLWSQIRDGGIYSEEEAQAVEDQFGEIYALKEAGEGRLVGIIEGPELLDGVKNTYEVEYTLADGETVSVGGERPSGKQAANTHIDELEQLRDSGAGRIIAEQPFPIGLGRYTVRFTLSDGEQVDLILYYPPGTAAERAAIFSETRELKQELRFTVLQPRRTAEEPDTGVWGILRYELADGRTVGHTERVPDEAISPDGQFVVLPGLDEPIAIDDSAP